MTAHLPNREDATDVAAAGDTVTLIWESAAAYPVGTPTTDHLSAAVNPDGAPHTL